MKKHGIIISILMLSLALIFGTTSCDKDDNNPAPTDQNQDDNNDVSPHRKNETVQ